MSKKKKTDREEELLIAGINARISEIRQQVHQAVMSGSSDEKVLQTISPLVEELRELLDMKENL